MKKGLRLTSRCFLGLGMMAVVIGQINDAPAVSTSPATADAMKIEAARGRALFTEKCEMCHGTIGMGTGLLARRLPLDLAELAKRKDLTAEFIEIAVRSGIGNMPQLSRAEVSDAQLAAIAAYLSKDAK